MGISIESARSRLHSSYGVNVEKYTSDEIVDEFGEKLEAMTSMGLSAVLPVIITGVTMLTIAITSGILLHSVVFGILFFLFSIFIFLFGAGALGISKAAGDLCDGISFILAFATNITNDIRNGMAREDKISADPRDITLLVLYGLVFPIVKKIIRNHFLGGIVYFIIEKAVNRGSRQMEYDPATEKNSDTVTYSGVSQPEASPSLSTSSLTVSQKIRDVSIFALKSLVFILKIIGVLFILVGIVLIALLCVVFALIA